MLILYREEEANTQRQSEYSNDQIRDIKLQHLQRIKFADGVSHGSRCAAGGERDGVPRCRINGKHNRSRIEAE